MGRACTVCQHPEREAVDEAVVSGQSYRSVSKRFGVSVAAVGRHSKAHLSPALAAVHDEREHERAGSLLDRVESLVAKLESLAEQAAERGQAALLLATARELRETYKLAGKLTGELDERAQVVNVLVSPEWQQVRAALLAALSPYPDARLAVSGRLLELEAGS